MLKQIRAFIQAHPEGWGHQEWLGLLSDLEAAGVDVSDSEEIGATLERERLAAGLKGLQVKGLGPKRVEALVGEYRTLWNLRQASAEDVAEIRTVPGDVAERVVEAVRT